MDLNLILFPAPKSSYSIGKTCGELVWIPKNNPEQNQSDLLKLCTAPDFQTRSPEIRYNHGNNLRVKNFETISRPVSKPLNKDTGLDDGSFVSTDSSKKQSSEDKVELECKAYSKNPMKPEQSSENNEILDESRVPYKTVSNAIKRNITEDDHVEINTSCCKEGVPFYFIDDYYKRVPNKPNFQDNLQKYLITETDRIIVSDRNVANKPLHYHQPINHATQKSINGYLNAQNISLIKTDNYKEENPSKFGIECKENNQNLSKLKHFLDKSQTNFDSNVTDEYLENRASVSTPRNVINYCTKTLPKPRNKIKNLLLTEISEHKDAVESDFLVDKIQEHETPSSARIRYEGYDTSKRFNSYKNSNLTASLLSPVAYKRATFLNNLREQMTIPAKKKSSQINPKQTNIAPRQKEILNLDSTHIPCLLLRSSVCSSKMLVYFHGNGEDIDLAKELLIHVRDVLEVNVLAVEYPGYGLYKGAANESKILEDSEHVYEYLVTSLKIHPHEIIIFGRSIGTGPATYLASKKNIGALILMSPFTSIKAVVKDMVGAWAQYLFKERFNNLEAIKSVACPTFIVHGQRDKVIPFQQSKQLHEACHAPSELILPKKMSHTEFDFNGDFTQPLIQFLERCNIDLEPKGISGKIYFPKKLFEVPDHFGNKDFVRETTI